MPRNFRNHLNSILFIGILFLLISFLGSTGSGEKSYTFETEIKEYLQLDFLDLSSPEDLTLLRESLEIFEPASTARHDSLIAEIKIYQEAQLLNNPGTIKRNQVPGREKLTELALMLLKFALIYILVLLVTYYAVETFGIYRFFRAQQGSSFLAQLRRSGRRISGAGNWSERSRHLAAAIAKLGRGFFKSLLYLALFAPAYVIAYSFKTRFDSGSLFLMILLAVISNGLLITYTQKYFTFLVQESRKGYVQTAIVKSMKQDYRFDSEGGIALSTLFRLKKKFPGHVFDQIYENVRFQYLQTLKEQASYLISGLIIIEMALNIQGHLCYELMQQILYKNISLILVILFGIFLIVKLTEMVIDGLVFRQQRRLDSLQPGGNL
jgi:hypothetical protein